MDGLLADPADVANAIPWELEDQEEYVLKEAIDTLSEDARFYGLATWVDVDSAPRHVSRMVGRAASRHMMNPEGYVTSRAGDETVSWAESDTAGVAAFTKREIEQLRSYRSSPGLMSAPMVLYGKGDRRTVPPVPVDDGTKRFPYPYPDWGKPYGDRTA